MRHPLGYRWAFQFFPVGHSTVAEFFARLSEPPKEAQQRDPFVPLTIVRPSMLEVEMPCGATLRLPDGNERLLQQVLRILLEREVVQP